VNRVKASGVFSNLSNLLKSLPRSDLQGITDAAEGLKEDLANIVRCAAARPGARAELESRQNVWRTRTWRPSRCWRTWKKWT
jgi:hypothetical protein